MRIYLLSRLLARHRERVAAERERRAREVEDRAAAAAAETAAAEVERETVEIVAAIRQHTDTSVLRVEAQAREIAATTAALTPDEIAAVQRAVAGPPPPRNGLH